MFVSCIRLVSTSTSCAHTRTLKGLSQALRIGDNIDYVQLMRAKLVSDFDKVDSLHTRVMQSIGENPDLVAQEEEWLTEVINSHREILVRTDKYLKPLTPVETVAPPKSRASKTSSRRSHGSRSSSSSSRLFQDAQLQAQELALQAQLDEESKIQREQAAANQERIAKMQELDAEQERLEVELENIRQAQDMAKQQRKVQHELELANQKIQFLSGSQADDNEFVDPRTSPSRSIRNTQLTPPASRLDLNGGFNVPNSVSLLGREGDAALGTGFPRTYNPSTFSRAVGQQRQTFPLFQGRFNDDTAFSTEPTAPWITVMGSMCSQTHDPNFAYEEQPAA